MDSPRSAQSQGVDGRAPSFEQLYQSEFSYVWHALRRLGVRSADLEDCVHQVFLTAWRRLGAYDPARPLRPWLFGIAFRTAADFRALARHGHEVLGDVPDVHDERPHAEQQLAAGQAQLLVARALDRVEVNRRAVFVMKEMLGHTVPDIAEALGIPVATAYSQLRLAREDFVASLRALQGGGS